MPERITKTQRWLDLIAYLVGRRLPVPVEELMEGIPAYAEKWRTGEETAQATARRTFERDKDELKALGIPLETVKYTINWGREEVDGYRIARRDFYLPYLRLAAGDVAEVRGRRGDPARPAEVELPREAASAAMEALRHVADLPAFPYAREARSALRKLTFDLGPAAVPESPVLFVDRPGAGELVETLRALSEALLARKRMRFVYHGIRRGEATERDVAAYGLMFQRGNWYLVGHDAARDAIRVFRVGRMEAPAVNARAPKSPDYAVPAGFRLADYLDREAWELGEESGEALRARVLFRFPASLWAARNGMGEAVEERADGSAVREFDVAQVNPFLRWLLGLGGDARLLEPPELAAELEALAREVAARHGGEAAGG
ncbi:MAG TPA: WYL domain-containing protein [Longimicrobiales bacterium]|nr:WYL domain-containing protein [Longimicrobiales bacterium]